MDKDITVWVENPNRDYAEGVRLLSRYGGNSHQVRVFSKRSPRFAMPELVAELRRLNKSAAADQRNALATLPAHTPSLPKVVDAAKQLVHDCWVKLSKFLSDLFDVGEANGEKEIAARLLLLDAREPYIERYNSVYEAKEAFFAGKITEKQLQEVVDGKTVEAVLHPPKPKEHTPLRSLSDLTLAKAVKAAKQCITRYNNQLRYQHDTAQKNDNPMPQCPKRSKIEKRMAEKQKELSVLEEELKKRG
jgi:hypothetical protein